MCTVLKVVSEVEKFLFRYGYLDHKRNYEFSGPYGGYVFAGIKDLRKLRELLYSYRLVNRECDKRVEIEFDHSENRVFIRIRTVAEN